MERGNDCDHPRGDHLRGGRACYDGCSVCLNVFCS